METSCGSECPDLDDDTGIAVTPAKTAGTSGVALLFNWSAELRETVDAVLAIPPKRRDPDAFLFTTKAGAGFYDEESGKAHGFDTLWSRFIDRGLAEGVIERRIRERDLRAVVGAESDSDEDAQARLGHASVATTRRHYRRRARRVEPLSARE